MRKYISRSLMCMFPYNKNIIKKLLLNVGLLFFKR